MHHPRSALDQALERLRDLEAELTATREKLDTLARWQTKAKDELKRNQEKLETYERWIAAHDKKPSDSVRECWVPAATAAALLGYTMRSLTKARVTGVIPAGAWRKINCKRFLYDARILQTLDRR